MEELYMNRHQPSFNLFLMTKDFSLLILKILKFNVFFINFEQFGIFLFLKIHLYKYPAFGG